MTELDASHVADLLDELLFSEEAYEVWNAEYGVGITIDDFWDSVNMSDVFTLVNVLGDYEVVLDYGPGDTANEEYRLRVYDDTAGDVILSADAGDRLDVRFDHKARPHTVSVSGREHGVSKPDGDVERYTMVELFWPSKCSFEAYIPEDGDRDTIEAWRNGVKTRNEDSPAFETFEEEEVYEREGIIVHAHTNETL